MIRSGISFSAASTLILGVVLLASAPAAAQRHGGGGMGGGGLSGSSRPSGVQEKDSLKDFHKVIALQATSEQIAEFQTLLKTTAAAKVELQLFLQHVRNENGAAGSIPREGLDLALENARNGQKHFQQGFSGEQKSGLKDLTKRLAKADSELEQEEKKLDQSTDVKAAVDQVEAHAESLDRALTDFGNQQLALGREMSITLATGKDLAFALPTVNHPINIANQMIGVPVSGELEQIAAQAEERTFKLEVTADLSDLQQNITDLLRAQLDSSESCGQRVAVRRATLAPSSPASVVVLQLHFERWSCTRTFGQQTSNELAEEDGTVEVKVTAAMEKPHTLKIVAALGRIDATGMMGEALRSGSLGEDLRDIVAKSVLTAAQSGAELTIFPSAVQNAAIFQSAKFQDTGVGILTLVLDGQIQISNQQADLLASQLNQALSAQGVPPR